MTWFERLSNLVVRQAGTPPKNARASIPTDKAIVRDYLVRAGVRKPSAEDVIYLASAFGKVPPRVVWKSPQFSEIAAKAGRSDLKSAWLDIAKPCNSALACARDLRRAQSAGIDAVKFLAGKPAVGECAAARSFDGTTQPIASVDLIPLKVCDRPDQCGCQYQSWLPWADELGL